ncbi:serine/threonine-protein kinase [Aquabacter cavernae]|uniref:serine/threonine-protein kinase n=1 Tax=Aquabacter cavernae TaxID=2496029 RepID=UPI000F8D10F2|nr:serine/threonine-protein kinase [Aquabacter cavernae]
MAIDPRLNQILTGFFAGRRTFDQLTLEVRGYCRDHDPMLSGLSSALQEQINLGRMPYDLAMLLFQEAGRPAEEPARDLPELPPVGEAEDNREETLRERVDSVVLSALLGQFKDLRKGGEARERQNQRQLDDALAAFRSARLRQDARKSAAGSGRPIMLGRDGREENRVGQILRDRFVLDAELGRGGMGVVYRAVDRRRVEAADSRPYVAIKLLNGNFGAHPDALRAMEAEARRTQDLSHPNIVAVHDFDRDGTHPFIVMELLEGRSLDVCLRGDSDFAGSPAAWRAIRDMFSALAHAHSRGVTHADLKLANLFLSQEGPLKVLDFGIASAARAGDFDVMALDAMTPAYASPEQLRGGPRDPRDDVYAFGCIIHLMLTRKHPFDRTPATEAQERGMEPPVIAGLTDAMQAAVDAALAFRQDERHPDAGAFLAAFQGR